MAQTTWILDALTGVYKNHALSNELLKQSALDFQVAQYAQPVGGYGKNKGETVNLFYYKDPALPADPTLDETLDIPLDKLAMATHSLTVREMGRGIEITNLYKQLSAYDPDEPAQDALKTQMKRIMDREASAAGKLAKIVATPTSASALTLATGGVPGATAAAPLSMEHLGIIRDYMASTLHIPYYKNKDHYICLAATNALRGLKKDPDFIAWQKYLQEGALLYRSEVGRAENIVFNEVTNEEALANSVGTGGCTGEALFFGDKGIALAEAEAPHLRYEKNKGTDFGRKQAVAWYGILTYGLFFDTADDREARVISWRSA